MIQMRNWGITQTCIRMALALQLSLLVTVTISDNWRDIVISWSKDYIKVIVELLVTVVINQNGNVTSPMLHRDDLKLFWTVVQYEPQMEW